MRRRSYAAIHALFEFRQSPNARCRLSGSLYHLMVSYHTASDEILDDIVTLYITRRQ